MNRRKLDHDIELIQNEFANIEIFNKKFQDLSIQEYINNLYYARLPNLDRNSNTPSSSRNGNNYTFQHTVLRQLHPNIINPEYYLRFYKDYIRPLKKLNLFLYFNNEFNTIMRPNNNELIYLRIKMDLNNIHSCLITYLQKLIDSPNQNLRQISNYLLDRINIEINKLNVTDLYNPDNDVTLFIVLVVILNILFKLKSIDQGDLINSLIRECYHIHFTTWEDTQSDLAPPPIQVNPNPNPVEGGHYKNSLLNSILSNTHKINKNLLNLNSKNLPTNLASIKKYNQNINNAVLALITNN